MDKIIPAFVILVCVALVLFSSGCTTVTECDPNSADYEACMQASGGTEAPLELPPTPEPPGSI